MTGSSEVSDAELVAGVLAADRESFAAVYDRYGSKLYDFAYSMLRQREDAADAVADSFVIVAERLNQLRDPERLRPWLYAIVRSECLRLLRARKKVAYGDDERFTAMADDALTPDLEAERAAAQQIVWDAAAGLADRDRALLDLHLRQGLEGAELAEAMGVSTSNAYVMINRLKAQVDRSLGALLIARMGRDDCEELNEVLDEWNGTYSPLVRKRVARHVDDCDVCGQRRKKMVAPWALLATVPIFAAPLALRDRVVNDTQLVAFAGTPSSTAAASSHWTKSKVAVAAAATLVVAGSTSYLAWSASDRPEVAAPTPTVSVEPGPTPAPTVEPTTAPGTIRVSTLTVQLAAGGSDTTVTLFNIGDEEVTYQATSDAAWLTLAPDTGSISAGGSSSLGFHAEQTAVREGTYSGTVSVTWPGGSIPIAVTFNTQQGPVVGAPTTVSNPNCSVPVSVSVRDQSRISQVVLQWTGPSGPGSAGMQLSGGLWRAQMGHFFAAGPVTMTAIATDVLGNKSTGPATTVSMLPCPG